MLQKGTIGKTKNKKMKKQDKGITKMYLVENCNGDPLSTYVGKTKNKGNIRKSSHKKTFGDKIIFTVIDEINSLDSKDWKPLESYWIEQFRYWGFNVLNKNGGGGGPSSYTEEQRQKMSKPRINFPKGKNHGLFRKSKDKNHITNMCTVERAKNISIARTGNIYPNASTAQQGKIMPPHTDEAKFKIGKKHEKPVLKYNLEGDLIKEYPSIRQAALNLKKNPCAISRVCNGKQKTAYGYVWKHKI